jgi:hypothetical protein
VEGERRTVEVTPDLTVDEIISCIAYLASDRLAGREAGTPECTEVGHYLAGRFREYGLTPAGDAGTFYQPFEFTVGVKLGEGNRLTTHIPPPLQSGERPGVGGKQLTAERDFLPQAFSANATAKGEVVFAGYGIRAQEQGYDDYAGLDVAGKMVLVLRFGPEGNDERGQFGRYLGLRAKARTAQQQGAAGILFCTGPGQDEEENLGGFRFDGGRREGIPAAVVRREVGLALLGRTAEELTQWQNEVAARLKEPPPEERHGGHSLQVPPGVTAELACHLEPIQRATANILGKIEGSDPTLREQVIILGAHYDHVGIHGGEVYNGADDNASGTAGLLELAQYFAAHRDETRRTLLFSAYSAEEKGLLGSQWFVQHPTVPLDRVVAMLNLDMIGRAREGTFSIGGVGTSPAWTSLVETAGTSAALVVKTSPGSPGDSDHASFYGRNIPILFFFTGLHPDYHRPPDNWDKINADGEVEILRLVVDVIHRLNAHSERIAFTPVPSGAGGVPGQARAFLGTMAEPTKDESGVLITGLTPNGPASHAGLCAGDVVIEFRGQPVKNMEDYLRVISETEPEQPAPIAVLRNGQRVELTLVPTRR